MASNVTRCQVTKEDITFARQNHGQGDIRKCPLARALTRLYEHEQVLKPVRVSKDMTRFGYTNSGYEFINRKNVWEWVQDFDGGVDVEEVVIVLDFDQGIMYLE